MHDILENFCDSEQPNCQPSDILCDGIISKNGTSCMDDGVFGTACANHFEIWSQIKYQNKNHHRIRNKLNAFFFAVLHPNHTQSQCNCSPRIFNTICHGTLSDWAPQSVRLVGPFCWYSQFNWIQYILDCFVHNSFFFSL